MGLLGKPLNDFGQTEGQRRISLIIAEAALETVPKEIVGHNSVRSQARRLDKRPQELLLDRSYHHAAMKQAKLEFHWKRGRPDIVHLALLEAFGTPLFLSGRLEVFVHTVDNRTILFAKNVRIPKSYFRFEGLMIDLFKNKKSASRGGPILLELHDNVLFENLILDFVKPDLVVGLTTAGVLSTAQSVVLDCVGVKRHCAFVVGGFPRGHFSDSVTQMFDRAYSLGLRGLEAHLVIGRILYECEKILSIS